ncbi:alpha-glucan phosphorylase [Desulfocarbo indianensis]|nr:alpha-glucan phosphorylase [Desulfocarbo indianensis]
MRPTLSFQVRPKLPKQLTPLTELCHNLWFSWSPEAVELFQRIDSRLWPKARHNPVALLNQVSQKRLESLAKDSGFVAQMERVHGQLKGYLGAEGCPFLGDRTPPDFKVAYFSAEYGLADCLPIYSGGLGMLSGDHLKSASNLNVPLVAVGLAYRQGYFTQYLNPNGWQQEEYHPNDFWNLPMELVRDEAGNEVSISVDIMGQPLTARIWLVRVGRVSLYLMDANVDANPPELRAITHQLYGGDREMRIRQEILLGIGGVRLLEALGIKPNAFHMNEGHSAFASLERIRLLRQNDGLSFDEAREVVRASNVFTTHTPVPAGNDYFEPDMVKTHFQNYVGGLGISMPVLLGYGRTHPTDQEEQFCMTVLALRLSGFSNGVSRLHGQVSRDMWKEVWPHFPPEDVPIGHITNGVHIPSWLSTEMAYLYHRYLGPEWNEDPDSQAVWARVLNVPDSELWRAHERRRARLISFVRNRLAGQLKRRGASPDTMKHAREVLNDEALTIVFARRFATYKRAIMLFRDLDRLAAIVGDPQCPVQFIFAGKAHPKDAEGKEFIRRVVEVAQDPRFRDHMVFLEDYDINVARYLVQGADVWLNNPRRPLEACGTSGMKSAANGGLNLSILDGWWDEGYEPGLGWAIGSGEEYENPDLQDQVEAQALYRLLESEVVPLYYRRDQDGLPRGWIRYMKRCLARLCPIFNTHRMLEDYSDLAYVPAAESFNALKADNYARARDLGGWVRRIMENWSQVQVLEVNSPLSGPLTHGQEVEVRAKVKLGNLLPSDVACDIYFGALDAEGEFAERKVETMQDTNGQNGVFDFQGSLTCDFNGQLGLSVRVVPYHPQLSSRYALGLAAWG